MTPLKVAIVDSGIDLRKLYDATRHGYEAVWVPAESLSFAAISDCQLLIIPTGSDATLLAAKSDCLLNFRAQGGWIFCFDGVPPGILAGLCWTHTPTDYRAQQFHVPDSAYAFLLDDVSLEELAVKDGVRGWWCEGEIHSPASTTLIADERNRVIACMMPPQAGAGGLIATAAGRLPLFSPDPHLAPNVLFRNLLSYCARAVESDTQREKPHFYLYSGNWAQRSFVHSDRFRDQFTPVHWSCVDDSILAGACSVWIPWESNTRALRELWPRLEAAVAGGVSLVIEDLRNDWLPGYTWQQRPVDSSWWREGRPLDMQVTREASRLFPWLSDQAYAWHYHGVFDCPESAIPLVTTSDGKAILAYCPHTGGTTGGTFVSTLDATFEYGAGKIPQTATYIEGVLRFLSTYQRSLTGPAYG
jgi:hypothetical protein